MASVDKIRYEIIEKIMSIENKAFLEALDQLIATSQQNENVYPLNEFQKQLLLMSEEDIKYGSTITQEELLKRKKQWLNDK
ncbi:hypothetical protein [Luteibaculum oceani]|uniref:Addiction module protein n=1 Tax=Luteibaculum oceani TaxID=1294296 RepID=A0A5C6V044_9FLAO|nr:hypothetical protein [Luteibaculum oceani]TXC78867.1 hypothetical protein FRX97_06545 [Luteibaculum oceani]